MNLPAQIFSSKARAEIFRLLFGLKNRELHLREIERQTGFAIGTVRQETEKLVGLGLLIKRQDGNRTCFLANRNHLLYAEIHNIILKTTGLTDVLRKALDHPDIRFAFIFGSIASGNEASTSDIDLLIIGSPGLGTISRLLAGASNLLSREINPVTMPEKEFVTRKKARDHFLTQVLKAKKIMLKGTDNELANLG